MRPGHSPHGGPINPWRRTTLILLATIGATIVLGLPAGASERAATSATGSTAPRVVHTGPECFAGASPQQVSRARGD